MANNNAIDGLCQCLVTCVMIQMAQDVWKNMSSKNKARTSVVVGVAMVAIFAALLAQQVTSPYRSFTAVVCYGVFTAIAGLYTLNAFRNLAAH